MRWWIWSENAVYLPQTQQLLVLVHLDVDAGRNVSFLFEVKLQPDGAKWIPLFELVPSNWRVLCRLNDGTALIAAETLGDEELLIFNDNRIQQRRTIKFSPSISVGIYADNDQVYVLGFPEEICYIDQAENIVEKLPARFNAIHGVPGEFVVVVGEEGAVGLRKHGQWNFAIDSPTNLPLGTVYCRSANEIYVGGRGMGFRWDGDQRWEEIKFSENASLDDFLEFNGVIYASAEQGIFRIQGNSAERISELHANKLFTLPDNRLGVTLWRSTSTDCAGIAILDGDQWVVHEHDVLNRYATQLEALLKTMPY